MPHPHVINCVNNNEFNPTRLPMHKCEITTYHAYQSSVHVCLSTNMEGPGGHVHVFSPFRTSVARKHKARMIIVKDLDHNK